MYVPILSMYYYRYIHVWYSRGTTLRHRGLIIDVRDGWGCEKLKTKLPPRRYNTNCTEGEV